MPAGDIVRPYRVSCHFSAKSARPFATVFYSEIASAFEGSEKRYLVRIFKVAADGHTVSKARNLDAEGLYEL